MNIAGEGEKKKNLTYTQKHRTQKPENHNQKSGSEVEAAGKHTR